MVVFWDIRLSIYTVGASIKDERSFLCETPGLGDKVCIERSLDVRLEVVIAGHSVEAEELSEFDGIIEEVNRLRRAVEESFHGAIEPGLPLIRYDSNRVVECFFVRELCSSGTESVSTIRWLSMSQSDVRCSICILKDSYGLGNQRIDPVFDRPQLVGEILFLGL